MKDLLAIRDLSAVEVEELLVRAQCLLEEGCGKLLPDCFVANLFFENSTRTRFSFEVAQKKLGIHVLNFQDTHSSMQKGESVYDTLKSLEAIGVQAAVIRHSDNGFFQHLKQGLSISLINAGTGNEEHPTQALLDLLTMKQEFSTLKGLNVAIIGDIRHSRVARSNFYALKMMGASVIFSGPDIFRPDDDILRKESAWLPLEEALSQADVVMLLRIQFERHKKHLGMDPLTYFRTFGLTEERAHLMPDHAIVMHPGPVNRGVEMAPSLVESPRSRIFKQMQNGVAVRMAVLEAVLSAQGSPLTWV